MTYIVNDNCIKCKLTDCVDVCPVDCFYEGKNMLVIKPDECIDCGVCEPECPVDAIKADTEPGSEKWLEINKKYSEIWPNISEKKDPPSDHEKYKDEKIFKTIEDAKIIEENSNQILDFTREVKNLPEQDKIKIIEALWSIIYSNKDADIYETNLMRRLAGLLYIDNKTMGDIKEKIKKNLE